MILHFPVEDHVAVCLEERVPILSLFWGDPTAHVERAHAAGVKVVHQVGSVQGSIFSGSLKPQSLANCSTEMAAHF